MAHSLIELTRAFFEQAAETDEGRRMLEEVGPSNLGDCVYDFDIEDGPGLHIWYRGGRFEVREGRYDGPTDNIEVVGFELRRADFEDLLEGRVGITEAHRDRKYYMAAQPELNLRARARVCLWGTVTRIGQELVRADKARQSDWLNLQAEE